MFEPLNTSTEQLRIELILHNNWTNLSRWFEELPKIVTASTISLTSPENDLVTEIEGFVEIICEIRQLRTIITHKADQLQEIGNRWAEEMETSEIEEDIFNKCNSFLEKLNKAEEKLLSNVRKLTDQEEIKNGDEKERVQIILHKI